MAIQFASEELRSDAEVVMCALAGVTFSTLRYASEELREGGLEAYVQQQLRTHTTFTLTKMDAHFDEQVLNDLIASFADVPSGKRRSQLHCVRDSFIRERRYAARRAADEAAAEAAAAARAATAPPTPPRRTKRQKLS